MSATPFSSPVLRLEVDGHVATLTLDRPEARNAMGRSFWEDLPKAMETLDADPEVRVVVLNAEGPHFSVGLDLKEMTGEVTGGSGSSSAARALATRRNVRRLQDSISSVEACRKPVIAAVHGLCIGGGVDLITACDIRIASRDAVFSVREAKMAMVADVGSLQRLPAIIGKGHLLELAYTGKDIDAQRAAEIHLVNHVVDEGAATDAARAIAAEIAANSPLAVQGTKAVVNQADAAAVAAGLEYVAVWNSSQLASNDLIEAVTAFIEKRPPNFSGS